MIEKYYHLSQITTLIIFTTLGRFTSESKDQTTHLYKKTVISVYKMLVCICKKFPIDIVFIALKYIQRVGTLKRTCLGSESQLFLIALITSMKYNSDNCYKNKLWSRITLTPLDVLLKMEYEFLECLDYNLNVCEDEFKRWVGWIQEMAVRYETLSSSFVRLTYFQNFDESKLLEKPSLIVSS